MEGRNKPPLADHPFPDRVEIWRLWGSPAAKAFIKTYCIFFTGVSVFFSTWIWLRDEGRGPFGCELRTPEEVEKAMDISQYSWRFKSFSTIAPKVNASDPIGSMFFDDGREFRPPKESALTKNMDGPY